MLSTFQHVPGHFRPPASRELLQSRPQLQTQADMRILMRSKTLSL